MQSLYVLSVICLAVAAAQNYQQPEITDSYPVYVNELARQRRDVTVDKKVGDGRIFGNLGQNEKGLYGQGGYEHQVFNDHRGQLDAKVTGTRVIGPGGGSSHVGGGLNWQNPNAAASLDVSHQIHGGTSYKASAGGKWPVGKNGDVSVQGNYGREAGRRHQWGGSANFNYRW